MDEKKEIEVDSTDCTKGKIVVGLKAFGLPTPALLSSVMNWVRNTCIGGITLVAGTDLFTQHQVKVICFILGAIALAAGGTKANVGVDSSKKN